MHFLSKNMNQPPKDFAYWRDLTLGAIGAVLLIRCLGDVLDWLKSHNSTDRNDMIGCLSIYALVALMAPRRLRYVFFFTPRHSCMGHSWRNLARDPHRLCGHNTLCSAGLPLNAVEGTPTKIGLN